MKINNKYKLISIMLNLLRIAIPLSFVFFSCFVLFLLSIILFVPIIKFKIISIILFIIAGIIIFLKSFQKYYIYYIILAIIYCIFLHSLFGGPSPSRVFYNNLDGIFKCELCYSVWKDNTKKATIYIKNDKQINFYENDTLIKYKMYLKGNHSFVLHDSVTDEYKEIMVFYIDSSKIILAIDTNKYHFSK